MAAIFLQTKDNFIMDMNSKKNHGTVKSKASRGQSFQEDYGKDGSDYTGSATDERGGKLAGGKSDISHSISGNKVPRG